MSKKILGLAELIRSVYEELVDAQKQREEANELPIFEVEKLELEIGFTVSRSGSGKGGINIQIAEIGSELEYSNEKIHRIHLTLRALPDENNLVLPSIDRKPTRALGRRPQEIFSNQEENE